MKDSFLSLIRHAATFLGGYLLAKGYATELVSNWLSGAIFTLAGAIWGSVDEYLATGSKLQFALSIIRHALTTIGGYFSALGKISLEHVETIVGFIMTIAGTILGSVDEYTYATNDTTRISSASNAQSKHHESISPKYLP
ncbi:hypothetical protein [Ereboglobus luteus]|uniref:Holin n=1 Tax=Ereboglobus luteus TaxID=1796921 RepID=A0A2U8E5U6_9BACT|nr:hypothetical protein [Ereboglobus luteus]AWI10308.1 hypothetical protein CKA38_14540 [Ereboglobus luteus]